MNSPGIALEARVQRMFLAQGIFAERTLFPAAAADHRLMATDIDVLVSEYSSGFHLTRRHAECKSGRRVGTLDRILWLTGVRAMLGADASYLVITTFDEAAADFARSLSVDVMTVKQLETWEKALNIQTDHWPNRSDFRTIDPIRKKSLDLGKPKSASESEKMVRKAIQFAEVDSWRTFGYGKLNRLLGILKNLSDASEGITPDGDRDSHARYAASVLLVRLSQYLLAVCHDISRVPVSDMHSYLLSRLTFGDQNPDRASGLVRSTVDWMSQALRNRDLRIPPEVDSTRLFQPPQYSEGLVALTQKILIAPHEARYLPVSVETEQFGKKQELKHFPRLRSAWQSGNSLAALVSGFAVASLGVEKSLLSPLGQDRAPPLKNRKRTTSAGSGASSSQSKLDLEAT